MVTEKYKKAADRRRNGDIIKLKNVNEQLFDFITHCPTAYQTTAHAAEILMSEGYTELCESREWKLEGGHGYYVTRNGSSLIAFRVPACGEYNGFMITAAHGDSPAFKIKENATLSGGEYVRLSTEKYGGMLCSSWMDRPLSIAGRVTLRREHGIEVKNVDMADITAIIPNVAIHMNRNANDSASFNAARDMLPMYATCEKNDKNSNRSTATLRERVAEKLGVSCDDIITTDLSLYNPAAGVEWNGIISAPRLDDLQCAFASLYAFTESGKTSPAPASLPVCCIFDNEEVGSQTKQGAASTFLPDVLERISAACGLTPADHRRRVASSFLVSCDNAHAVHPNHPEYADPNHSVYMNRGIVIKYNASQRYTSDAVSAAIFKLVCESSGVPTQYYANRADMPGGSTLGNIANTQVSLNTVDIGLAQLAMHSSYETAGALDTEYMLCALRKFFESSLLCECDGSYRLQ